MKTTHIIVTFCSISILVLLLCVQLARMILIGSEMMLYLDNLVNYSTNFLLLYLILSGISLVTATERHTNIVRERSKGQYILIGLIAYFLTHAILKQYSINLHVIIKAVLVGGTFFYLLAIIEVQTQFMRTHVMEFFRNLHAKRSRKETFRIAHYVFHYVAISIVVMVCLLPLVVFHMRNVAYYDLQRKSFYIREISPESTIIAEEVTLEGYNFRTRNNETYRINTSYGPVVSNTWEDTKVTFIVPLHLKNGTFSVWLERPEGESSTSGKLRSNAVSLTLLPRESYYSLPEDTLIERVFKKLKRIVFLENKLFQKE